MKESRDWRLTKIIIKVDVCKFLFKNQTLLIYALYKSSVLLTFATLIIGLSIFVH